MVILPRKNYHQRYIYICIYIYIGNYEVITCNAGPVSRRTLEVGYFTDLGGCEPQTSHDFMFSMVAGWFEIRIAYMISQYDKNCYLGISRVIIRPARKKTFHILAVDCLATLPHLLAVSAPARPNFTTTFSDVCKTLQENPVIKPDLY